MKFLTVDVIAEKWGLDRYYPTESVLAELTRIKGPMLRPNPDGTRSIGLSQKNFDGAEALRAEALKPVQAKPTADRPITKKYFDKLHYDALAQGFRTVRMLAKEWSMTVTSVYAHVSYLDPTVKDFSYIIQDGRRAGKIPKEDRAGIWPDEFDRLMVIKEKKWRERQAAALDQNAKVDAEVLRLVAEKERYDTDRKIASEEWENRLNAARATIDAQWAKYKQKVVDSRFKRDKAIADATVVHDKAVDPLRDYLWAKLEDCGLEPEDGPRFSEQSEIWWTWQHKRNALSLEYGNKIGVHSQKLHETTENARSIHRRLCVKVWDAPQESPRPVEEIRLQGLPEQSPQGQEVGLRHEEPGLGFRPDSTLQD